MNEAETRAEYTDPQLKAAGWGEVDGSKVLREFRITDGKIQVGNGRAKPEIADYVLEYNNTKLAVIEAKRLELQPAEGVAQAKAYALKLETPFSYATNGKEIYEISLEDDSENVVNAFPTPDELWKRANA